MRKVFFILLLLLVSAHFSCGSRTPSQAKTANVAKKFFNKYGKKYKDTQFGQSRVAVVDVKEVRELQKNVATSLMVVNLKDGSQIPVIMTLIQKPISGWKTTSWEEATQN